MVTQTPWSRQNLLEKFWFSRGWNMACWTCWCRDFQVGGVLCRLSTLSSCFLNKDSVSIFSKGTDSLKVPALSNLTSKDLRSDAMTCGSCKHLMDNVSEAGHKSWCCMGHIIHCRQLEGVYSWKEREGNLQRCQVKLNSQVARFPSWSGQQGVVCLHHLISTRENITSGEFVAVLLFASWLSEYKL